jgi:acyl transferase domain-containing protein/thioesterase domain-containing protein/ubiquinone/menaquinone biosynthesis C-methylase UbiE/acyl carrier protein
MDSDRPDLPGFGVAVIGMSGRFPGAADVDRFWQNLASGVESIARLSDEDLAAAGVDPAIARDPRYVRARGLLTGVDRFDAAFFGMSPREAEITDPQHRLFLEIAWEALERAGYDPSRFPGPIGVYGGTGQDGYLLHHLAPNRALMESLGAVSPLIGNDKDYLATRVAYKLNLRGPALTVQSACSTGLVAVQLACQSLLSYQCDLALAGGVSIAFPLGAGYEHREGHILSPDGHCRAFDARAAGTVPGDGAAVVVLKRLAEAIADGDHVHAVIRGAAVNNDGAAKVGYTAPSIDGQAEVITMAHALAQVDAGTIGYVEAHGTGTRLGDPIEIAALTQAFRATTDRRGFCAIGSVKTNVGHLNTAAGITSFVKAVLALEKRQIPPSLHFERASPEIDFEASPFFVNDRLSAFEAQGAPRRAGVSSFGFGGTNAHVVLEEAPAIARAPSGRSPHVIAISARSEAALDVLSERLAAHLGAHPEESLADVSFTLGAGRRAFAHRRAIVARDAAEAIAALGAGQGTRAIAGDPGVVFLFPGQGAQHVGMAAELYRAEPEFARHLDACAERLRPLLGLDLRAAIAGAIAIDLTATAIAQPALFAVEYALARLLMAWGVTPAAMLGHSIGEYVAATIAGVLGLDDALAIVAARGRLMGSLPPGAMLAVPLPEARARELCGADLSLAVVNAPSSCVIAGPTEAVEALERRLAAEGIEARRLRASHAFHSAMMDPILAAFGAEVRKARLSPPEIPFVSNVTGTWISAAEATDPETWVRHLRGTVRFADGLATLASDPARVFVEVGPDRRLAPLVAACAPGAEILACLPRADRAESEAALLFASLARLWTLGAPVDWAAFHAHDARRRVPLPTYPFERERCWVDAPHAGPSPIEAERRALDAIEAEITARSPIRPLASFPGFEERMNALSAAYLYRLLRGAGVDLTPGAVHDRDALRLRLGVVPGLVRLFDAFLRILAEDGILRLEGDRVTVARAAPELADPDALHRAIEAEYPELRGLVDLLAHCAAHHVDAISGKVPAIGVLYPGGSSDFVDRCERSTVAFRSDALYIALLCEVVRRVADASPGRRLRILEIGGGRGMLTWPLAEALAGRDVEITFTDLGKVFVDDARAEADRRGLSAIMRFAVADAERDLVEQGFAEGSFDLVVAFNVVHATRDVGKAIRGLSRVLADDGLLGVVELVKTRRWDTLTWGLAEGFWLYADEHRTSSPLLPLATWEEVMRREGFARAEGYPRDAAARERADHGLLLARRRVEPVLSGLAPRRTRIAAEPPRAPAASAPPRAAPSLHPRPALRTPFVAPRTRMEADIARICGEILGFEALGVDDDFLDLGADSLITLRITDRLRRDLGLDVPAHAAFRGRTVARIAESFAPAEEARASESAILVPIQPEGSRPPLFFVHPAAGVVFPYFDLARLLGDEQPFYGLQAAGLDGASDPDPTIAAMARRYVTEIRAVQPKGPYHLGGFSFGCLVAYEMARLLSDAGDEVALLALVDEPAPARGHRPPAVVMGKILLTGMAKSFWPHLHDYLYLAGNSPDRDAESLSARFADLLRMRPDAELVQTFLARSAMANFIPREHRLLALRQPAMIPMFNLFLIHLRETLAYAPGPYRGKVTLYPATRLTGKWAKDPTMGWRVLAQGGVDVRPVPGEHLTVLRRPHVEVLARELAASLEEARRARR